MMLIFVVNSDCQCCVTVHFCVQYILGHDDRLRKPFESARPVIDVIFCSGLHQQLHHGVIFIFRRSHEWSSTLVIPCMNIRAVPKEQP